MKRGELDELDRRILHDLQTNARTTSSDDIAEAAGVSASTVRNRIRLLEEAGVVRGYHVDIDYELAGYPLFSMLVFLAMLTTAMVPVTMKGGVDWLEASGQLVYTRRADADGETPAD